MRAFIALLVVFSSSRAFVQVGRTATLSPPKYPSPVIRCARARSSPLLATQLTNIGVKNIIKLTSILTLAFLTRFKVNISRRLKDSADNVGATIEQQWNKNRSFGGGIARTLEVWYFSTILFFKYFSSKRFEDTDPDRFSAENSKLAEELTSKILTLGPTFIKLGQLLSTRIDVVPKEYINELVRLQDRVPPFPGDIAMRVIENELGKPISEIYDSFDPIPIAAASLGQVHIATLNGQKLAVKVQRRGLKKQFDSDLKNIQLLAILLDKIDQKTDGASKDWASIYKESARLLYQG